MCRRLHLCARTFGRAVDRTFLNCSRTRLTNAARAGIGCGAGWPRTVYGAAHHAVPCAAPSQSWSKSQPALLGALVIPHKAGGAKLRQPKPPPSRSGAISTVEVEDLVGKRATPGARRVTRSPWLMARPRRPPTGVPRRPSASGQRNGGRCPGTQRACHVAQQRTFFAAQRRDGSRCSLTAARRSR